jgi:farnesyl-diphosphate farnesyltransferase
MQSWPQVVKYWSETFYAPISAMPTGIQEAVASAYLSLRAIDEIEDHEQMSAEAKATLLRTVSMCVQSDDGVSQVPNLCPSSRIWGPQRALLPSVTLRLDEWITLCPLEIRPGLRNCVSAMADRMATWALTGWSIKCASDLDRYSFSVSGTIALHLTDIFEHYGDFRGLSRVDAIGFGNYLQAVNIIRGHVADSHRGVSFFPTGWALREMLQYAERNRVRAECYLNAVSYGPALNFCTAILNRSDAALDKVKSGEVLEFDGTDKP